MRERIINQGAAGCIFQYGFDCKGNKINTQKYITKIQKNENLSNNESEIGKKIQKMPHYKDFFSPVIECCNVDLAKYDSQEVEKCDFIQKTKEKIYKMCIIEYVGKKTLGDYVYDMFYGNPFQFVKTVANTYVYLLKSLQKLSDNDIVHYDIKENNIVCNSVNTPIIIDFGRSIDLTKLKPTDVSKYEDIFFVYEPDFDYWCLDINFLMYMFNELGENWAEQVVKREAIMKVIDDVFTKTSIVVSLQKVRNDYKQKQVEYFTKFEGKKWIDMFHELIGFIKTWDNYALAVTYGDMMLQFMDNLSDNVVLKGFNEMLVDIITATPDQRVSLDKSIEQAVQIFTVKIKKDVALKTTNKIKELSKNSDFNNRMKDRHYNFKLKQLHKDYLLDKSYDKK